jgi:hypothetical protein
VIRIAVSQAAFDAVADTLPLGSVMYEAELNARGERLIWIERLALNKLDGVRGPSESYSDVILRLVEMEAKGRR